MPEECTAQKVPEWIVKRGRPGFGVRAGVGGVRPTPLLLCLYSGAVWATPAQGAGSKTPPQKKKSAKKMPFWADWADYLGKKIAQNDRVRAFLTKQNTTQHTPPLTTPKNCLPFG